MPITALPAATVRLLGSAQIISSPISLVKELLDNAIDAKATSIEVFLSPNIVDKVEVRDNGVGIHPDDYDSLGKHAHTSKLGAFEELRALGGSTLGFRGEALASANALGKLAITTKTSSDPVAVVLQINPGTGGVLTRQPGPAPVGTTASITDLYDKVPVRKQVAVKEAPKTIAEVKGLLQSYAMARPQIKLSMKILKSPKQNWTYSPKPDAGVNEAILQFFGRDAAVHCPEKVSYFGVPGTEDRPTQYCNGSTESAFVFEACMVAPGAGLDRVPKQRYFSVDNRPVTESKGTIKKLILIYRKYVSSMISPNPEARTHSLENIFIRLNIKCPKGSYDINAEPSKDNPLFEDEGMIVTHFEELCKRIYAPVGSQGKEAVVPVRSGEANTSPSSVSRLEALKRPKTTQTSSLEQHEQYGETASTVNDASRKGWKDKVTIDFAWQEAGKEAPGAITSMGPSQKKLLESGPSSPPPTNGPSSQCETNIRGMDGIHSLHHTAARQYSSINSNMAKDSSRFSGDNPWTKSAKPSYRGAFPPTDAPQSIASPPKQPLAPWSHGQMNVQPEVVQARVAPSQMHLQGDGPGLSGAVELPILQHPRAPLGDLDLPPNSRTLLQGDCSGNMAHIPSSNPCQSPISSPIRPGLTPGRRYLGRRVQLPWTPPSSVRKDQDEWENRYSTQPKRRTGGLKQATISFDNHGQPVLDGGPRRREKTETGRLGSTVPLLAKDFKTASTIARQHLETGRDTARRYEAGSAVTDVNQGYKHDRQGLQNEETFAYIRPTNFQKEESSGADSVPIKTSLPSDDPRTYLLRRQKSMEVQGNRVGQKRHRRLKSCLMPLEVVPRDEQTHGLILAAKVDTQKLGAALESIQRYDQYVIGSGNEDALDLNLNEAGRVEERLDALLSRWTEQQTGEKSKIESHLQAFLKGSGTKVQV